LGGALVVDEKHDAAALRELLVGDRGELVDVALRVLDVDFEPGFFQTLLEVHAVEVLPAGRRRDVGKDHARTARGLAAAVAAIRGGASAAAGTRREQQGRRAAESGRGEE